MTASYASFFAWGVRMGPGHPPPWPRYGRSVPRDGVCALTIPVAGVSISRK